MLQKLVVKFGSGTDSSQFHHGRDRLDVYVTFKSRCWYQSPDFVVVEPGEGVGHVPF